VLSSEEEEEEEGGEEEEEEVNSPFQSKLERGNSLASGLGLQFGHFVCTQ